MKCYLCERDIIKLNRDEWVDEEMSKYCDELKIFRHEVK